MQATSLERRHQTQTRRRRPAQAAVAVLAAVLVVALVLGVILAALMSPAEAAARRPAGEDAGGLAPSASGLVARQVDAPAGSVAGVVGGLLGEVAHDLVSPRPVEAHARGRMLRRVIKLVNKARSAPRTCGDKRFAAVPRVRRNRLLDRAASSYARQMAHRDFFAHIGLDGLDPGDRLRDVGYRWRSYGENIAAGYSSPAGVVRAWLDSPDHCANLMGRYRAIGVGYAWDDDSRYGGYWVQEFASR